MDISCTERMATGFQPLWALDCATYVTMLVKSEMVVEGRRMRHLAMLPKRVGQSTARARLRGLGRNMSAHFLNIFGDCKTQHWIDRGNQQDASRGGTKWPLD